MKPQPLAIDLPRIDGDTQSRIAINEEAVQNYADLIAKSNGEWPFPPLDVFHDGTDYFVADGFHRILGAQKAKRGSVPCVIHKGTATDARIFGMTANDKHGLRMTRADKRACVEWLLDNGGKMTQAEIAEKAGVSTRNVRGIVTDRKPPSELPESSPHRSGRQVSGSNEGVCLPSLPDPFDDTEDPPGEDGRTESDGSDAQEPDHRPPRNGKDKPVDYGKCPNCAGIKWDDDEFGVSCAKCHHPHGEPAGDVDEDRMATQRQKTVKTVEALMRAFDDLQCMKARPEHEEAIKLCKRLLKLAKGWK